LPPLLKYMADQDQDLLVVPASDCGLFGHLIVIKFSTPLLIYLRVRNDRMELTYLLPGKTIRDYILCIPAVIVTM
jgi:hypothetical protein